MKKQPLTNKAGKVRELMLKDIQAMRPAREILPIDSILAGAGSSHIRSLSNALL